jgi:hypothetical protein
MMKKYILGILMLVAYLQPLVVNALVLEINTNVFHHNNPYDFSKSQPVGKNFELDAVVGDFDDEDESPETVLKHINADVYIQRSFEIAYLNDHDTTASLKSKETQLKHSTKPIYILWSVFRI